MLQEFVALIGMRDRLACVKTVAPTGADISRDPERALDQLADACNAAVREDGASCVILGGAGLAGIAARIAERVPVPLIDSLAASVKRGEELAAAALRSSGSGVLPVETVGLSAPLAALFNAT